MIEVEGPDGSVVEFPDGTPPETIKAAMGKRFGAPKPSQVQSFSSPVMGFVDAATAPVGNALQWANRGLSAIGAPTIPSIDKRVEFQRARIDANESELGKTAGEIGFGLAIAPTKGGAAVQGALQGAANSRADNVGGVAEDAAYSALASVIGDKAMRGVGAAISPNVRPAVARLKAAGAKLTPGEIIGGRAKVFEDKLMSLPLIGDAIASARRKGLDAFEEIAVNKALEPIGQALPKDKAGREAVRFAGDALSDSYSRLVPQLKGRLDKTFVTRIGAVRARANLRPDEAAKFDDVVQRELASAFDPQTGQITGKRFKQIEGRLNQLAASWRKSDNPFEKDLGAAVGDVREQLFSLLARQNPSAAKALRATNQGWRNLVAIENAASTAEGAITPGRLAIGVRQASSTPRKRGFARGTEPLSRLAQDGGDVLSNRTPNSFTADRLMAGGIVGGGAVTGATLLNPAIAAPGLLAVPYLPGGREAVEWLMTGRQGAVPRLIGRQFRRGAPIVAAMAPPLLAAPQN